MKALLFPGQGSQKIGMGRNHFDSNSHFARRVEQADSLLGYSLSEIMFEGPMEKLTQTRFTQPAIFLHSVALWETLEMPPDLVAGHSLGELSALVAAGVLDFEAGLLLVALRGDLMQRAGEQLPGTMAAIIGMDDGVVDEICKEATEAIQKPVVPANYNCPGQLVISGDIDAVKRAIDMASERGCRLAKILPVSGAFHSPLMKPAFDAFKEKLENVNFSKPICPVYSNFTAEPVTDPDVVKNNLLHQLVNPVRWTQTLLNMNRNGAKNFVEIGPGKVIQGLVKRTLNEIETQGYE